VPPAACCSLPRGAREVGGYGVGGHGDLSHGQGLGAFGVALRRMPELTPPPREWHIEKDRNAQGT
jgi:hypothetical protein